MNVALDSRVQMGWAPIGVGAPQDCSLVAVAPRLHDKCAVNTARRAVGGRLRWSAPRRESVEGPRGLRPKPSCIQERYEPIPVH